MVFSLWLAWVIVLVHPVVYNIDCAVRSGYILTRCDDRIPICVVGVVRIGITLICVAVVDTHGFDGDFNLNTRRSDCVLIIRISRIVHRDGLRIACRAVFLAILLAVCAEFVVHVERIVLCIRTRHCEHKSLEIMRACLRHVKRSVFVFHNVVDVTRQIKRIACTVSRIVSLSVLRNNFDCIRGENTAHGETFTRTIHCAFAVLFAATCAVFSTIIRFVGKSPCRFAATQLVERNLDMCRRDLSDVVLGSVNSSGLIIAFSAWIGKCIREHNAFSCSNVLIIVFARFIIVFARYCKRI